MLFWNFTNSIMSSLIYLNLIQIQGMKYIFVLLFYDYYLTCIIWNTFMLFITMIYSFMFVIIKFFNQCFTPLLNCPILYECKYHTKGTFTFYIYILPTLLYGAHPGQLSSQWWVLSGWCLIYIILNSVAMYHKVLSSHTSSFTQGPSLIIRPENISWFTQQ